MNQSIPHAISFFQDRHHSSILSSVYKQSRPESYFEQCFNVLDRIGEGSFGEVFKVRSKEDGRLYAIKKSIKLYRGETYRQERIEEVRRYEQFSEHENCITLHNAWEQNDLLYMQLELCQSNLETYAMENKNLTETKIWDILVDLLLALKALHDQNLIHLDIKLENIMIGEDNICKLGDFGLVIDLNRVSEIWWLSIKGRKTNNNDIENKTMRNMNLIELNFYVHYSQIYIKQWRATVGM